MSNFLIKFLSWLGAPFRMITNVFKFFLNLTTQQMRALFSLAMVGGIISLSMQNVWYTYRAEQAILRGTVYIGFFNLLLEQLRFNSGLIAWFAVIMGLIVFGADYFRARWGDKEVGMGKGTAQTITETETKSTTIAGEI